MPLANSHQASAPLAITSFPEPSPAALLSSSSVCRTIQGSAYKCSVNISLKSVCTYFKIESALLVLKPRQAAKPIKP